MQNPFEPVTKCLIARRLTITTMESITAGLIASLLTDTEGSSAVLKGAFVTYSNEAKILQGVPAETIDTYTVYSKETAEAMARACAKAYRADIGIGVTGTAGNTDPANPSASVPGVTYFAILFLGKMHSFKIHIPPQPSRAEFKMRAAEQVAGELMALLAQNAPQ